MTTPPADTAPQLSHPLSHPLFHQRALDAMRSAFYGGDLDEAERTGLALLAAIEAALGAAALPAAETAGAQAAKARALLWLVRCARRADALDLALARAATGIEAALAAGNESLTCLLLAQRENILASLGQNQPALDEGYETLRRATASADTLAQAACWLALGHVHWSLQQCNEGEQAYGQALTLSRQCGDAEIGGLASNGIAAMQDYQAQASRAAGRLDEALAHARRSLALLKDFTRSSLEIGDGYNAWIGTYNQACCLFGMGEHQAAHELLDQQVALLNGDRGYRYQLLLQVLGDVHLAEGRTEQAIACLTEAVARADRLQSPLLAMDAGLKLVDALAQRGDWQAALAQHRRYHALYVELASNKAQAHARAMAVLYETEKTQALAQAHRQRADELASANSSLIQEKAVLHRDSTEDALTGLTNRRGFDLALRQALSAEGGPPTCALVLIDVDDFKSINDRHSHLVGDEVLRRLGQVLQRCCRKQDLAARYGGEEFALILAEVDLPTAAATCERLRAAVEAEPWSGLHPELQVTVSIGVVHAQEVQAAGEPLSLLAMGDARLYAAKRGGRNRVVASAA